MRFFWQWIASEKVQKEALFRLVFGISAYSAVVFYLFMLFCAETLSSLLGNQQGLIIYVRNLFLIQREKEKPVVSPNQIDTA